MNVNALTNIQRTIFDDVEATPSKIERSILRIIEASKKAQVASPQSWHDGVTHPVASASLENISANHLKPLKGEPITDLAKKTLGTNSNLPTASADVASEPEAKEVASEQEAKEVDAIEKDNIIDAEIDSLLDQYQVLLDKANRGENIDHSRMLEIALKLLMCMMRRSGRYDEEQIQQLNLKIRSYVDDVKGTFHNPWGITLGVMGAVVSIASGLAGLSPLMGSRLFLAAATTKTLAAAAPSIGAIGNSFSAFEKITDNGKQAERAVCQNIVDEGKSHLGTVQQGREQTKGTERGSLHSLEDAVRSAHQAITHMFGNQ